MNEAPARRYEPIAVGPESTVVAEYIPDPIVAEGHQSEAELEREFIGRLQSQAYEHLRITSEAQLIANLRAQLEKLNDLMFSDAEWGRFFTDRVACANDTAEDKTRRIQEDPVQILTRDDGSTQNIKLIDKTHIHNNHLQVLNQYEVAQGDGGAARSNRYDVTVLVNGLPLVHIELKRRGVDIREAFNQINRYQRDSFWAGSGLFDYVQVFVISNGTLTKYYSNTTRRQHLKEMQGKKAVRVTSNSFEFTSWWADAQNKPIQGLPGFTRTFFARHTLLAVLTRYCVLTADRMLLVMRPYQIVATERILNRIEIAKNARTLGTVAAGGYIWHTTGSGKTLTSFKTAQLASRLDGVGKVLFVVDRKDLDYQTMLEYDRFEKGAANSNTSTAVLKRQLGDAERRSSSPRSRSSRRSSRATRPTTCTTGTSSSSSTSATAPSSATCTPPSPRRSGGTTCSGSPGRRSSRRTRPPAATRACGPRSRRSGRSCTPTRSWTRSPTRTCSRSASTT
jgi:type I restriction enzyme R subunit